MEMSRFEKFFVNRQGKGRRNSTKVRERLENLDRADINEVLEIGCGIGTVSRYVAETYNMQVTGTDFDPAQINGAKKSNPGLQNLRFQVEDAASMSFPDSSFDLVIAHNVFHHIPAWKIAMKEVHRVLRPSGHLIWLDLIFAKPIRGLLSAIENDESFFSLDEVRTEFRDVGFIERFHERTPLIAFTQHHFALQRT